MASQVLGGKHGNLVPVPHPCTCYTERFGEEPITLTTKLYLLHREGEQGAKKKKLKGIASKNNYAIKLAKADKAVFPEIF